MRILAIYVFREDGIPLISKFYDKRAQRIDGLVAPFLVSTSNRMEELTGSSIQAIELDENMYLLMEQFAEIICAIVVSERHNASLELNIVARRFYKQFHYSLGSQGWTGKLDNFSNFIPQMEQLLGIEPEIEISNVPHKVLDAFVMADYNKIGQAVIREIITHSEITLDRLVDRGLPETDSKEILEDLVSKDYIGLKYTKQGETIFFKLD